ncbi:MAG: hypothetical protein HY814_13300 [Candidatus Riflebacteria bacterium]|nr:hypothetical protein [Candidatus Riflebacteria bacterium]
MNGLPEMAPPATNVPVSVGKAEGGVEIGPMVVIAAEADIDKAGFREPPVQYAPEGGGTQGSFDPSIAFEPSQRKALLAGPEFSRGLGTEIGGLSQALFRTFTPQSTQP